MKYDENKNPQEINVDQVDMERMKESTTDLPALLEYAHSLGGFSIVPTEQGVIKGQALQSMQEQTDMQMNQLYEQMQLLAAQATKIKRRAEVSLEIYQANMGFKPLVGKTYYLYQKGDNKVLSIISPKEWKNKMPFEKFLAEVRLLADHTWDLVKDNL